MDRFGAGLHAVAGRAIIRISWFALPPSSTSVDDRAPLQVPAACCLAVLLSVRSAQAADFDPKAVEFFETDIRPLFVERCFKCHGDLEKPKGGLKLAGRAAVLAGGDTGGSRSCPASPARA